MDRAKGSVLIVDDEQALTDVVARTLESEGYNCVTAADGREALEKASLHRFDVVLLDIAMPGLSGIEVLPRLLADHPDTSVLMTTAAIDTQTAVEAINLGAYDYVTKPFSLIDLSAKIEEAVTSKRR
ncbi:MAG: response regulator [Dehalococcoidia bacterium]